MRLTVVLRRVVLFISAVMLAVSSYADLTIEITEGVDNPTKIAIVPFEHRGKPLGADLAGIIAA
ncbi:hypothetical protein N8793_08220, partial [Pseudomonadales bacterium]|nr:hypothetical protein [Pseudomonadales bacterium]